MNLQMADMNTNTEPTAPKSYDGMLMALSLLARLFCVLIGTMAGVRFLFDWTLMPTMFAGACAIVAAVIPPSRPGSNDHRSLIIIVLALLGIVFQLADIAVYYAQHDDNGKHYWWSGAVGYFVSLGLMVLYGAATLWNRRRFANQPG